MRQIRLAILIVLGSVAGVLAVPAGPPAGNPILNSHQYQKNSEMNIDTANVRSVALSTFTNAPSLPFGIRINGALYNSIGNNVPSGSTSVKDYGALGDGATDDRAAIQAAINFTAGRGGGVVFFPGGTYAIGTLLYVPSYVTLEGSGIDASIIKAIAATYPADTHLIQLSNTDGTSYTSTAMGEYITIRDLTLDCSNMPDATGNGTARGVSNVLVNHFTAERVKVIGSEGYGFGVEGSTGTYNVVGTFISHCILKNCGRHGGQDSIGGGFNRGSVYEYNLCDAPNGTCIDNVAVKNAWWNGNRSVNNSTTTHSGSIWSDFGMVDSKVTNNYIENGTMHIYGYLTSVFRGPPVNVIIQGNELVNTGSSALLVSAGNQGPTDLYISSGIVILGNTFNGCLDSCMVIEDSSGTIISNNNVNGWGTDSFAIYMLGTSIGNRGASIVGNNGKRGANGIWYHEAVNVVKESLDNVLIGNYFPGATISLSTTTPVTSYMDMGGGQTTISTNQFNLINTSDKSDGPNGTFYVSVDTQGRVGVHDSVPESEFVVRGSTAAGLCPFIGGGLGTWCSATYAIGTMDANQPGIMLGFDANGTAGGIIASHTSGTKGQPLSFMTYNGVVWGNRMIIQSSGTVRMLAYGAGTATFDANGNITASSDERLKNIDGKFGRGLADVLKMRPILYHWKKTTGLDTENQYAGFSAQNVLTAIPEATSIGKDGFYSLQDRPIIAALVNSVQELSDTITKLQKRMKSLEKK